MAAAVNPDHENGAGLRPSSSTTNHGMVFRRPAAARPRILYTSIFVWISVTGGRFLAPLLQDAGLSDRQMGLCLALQTVIQSLCSSASGGYADALEQQRPGRGRAHVLLGGIVVGSGAFLLQGLFHPNVLSHTTTMDDNDNNNDNSNSSNDHGLTIVVWHVLLRCVYAASTRMVFPVLDGLTLDFLNHHHHHVS